MWTAPIAEREDVRVGMFARGVVVAAASIVAVIGVAGYQWAPWRGEPVTVDLVGTEDCTYDSGRAAVVMPLKFHSVNDGAVTYEITVSVESTQPRGVDGDDVAATETVEVDTPTGASRRRLEVVIPMEKKRYADGYQRCTYTFAY